jgi:hypothetical protein
MNRLIEFVGEYKVFMKWLNGKNKDPANYDRKFEQIFSVTTETELLREIQDMKDELNMLSAVFKDQNGVLQKVGENIGTSRKAMLSKKSGVNASQNFKLRLAHNIGKSKKVIQYRQRLCTTALSTITDPKAPSVEGTFGAFIFQQQSEKHGGHIQRMQDQADQAYANVSALSTNIRSLLTQTVYSFRIS